MARMGSSGDGWGHIGATSGPRSIGSQRTTPVTIGQTTAQLTEQTQPSAAGHRDRPAVPDTEEVTPTAEALLWLASDSASHQAVHRRSGVARAVVLRPLGCNEATKEGALTC